MKKVEIIVIGAGKSGTSWLNNLMKSSSSFCFPDQKEIDYFSFKFSNGDNYYHSLFNDSNKLWVDNSPSYFSDANVPLRIYKYNPLAKLILILRDPLERAYSHYKMLLINGQVNENINATYSSTSRIVKDSMYGSNISNYLTYFPSGQLLLLNFDDLQKYPEKITFQLENFLGIEIGNTEINKVKVNARKGRPRGLKVYNWYTSMVGKGIRKSAFLRKSYKLYLNSPVQKLYNKLVFDEEGDFPKLSAERAVYFKKLFDEDILKIPNASVRNLIKGFFS